MLIDLDINVLLLLTKNIFKIRLFKSGVHISISVILFASRQVLGVYRSTDNLFPLFFTIYRSYSHSTWSFLP